MTGTTPVGAHTTVVTCTRQEAEQWRERLVERSGLSAGELAYRGAHAELSGEELDVWETVQALDWLLAGNPETAVVRK